VLGWASDTGRIKADFNVATNCGDDVDSMSTYGTHDELVRQVFHAMDVTIKGTADELERA
jgi:hypothetical protein